MSALCRMMIYVRFTTEGVAISSHCSVARWRGRALTASVVNDP